MSMSRRHLDRHDLATANARLSADLRQIKREFDRVQVERGILREASTDLIHHAPARDRFAFIHAHRDRFSLERLCRVLISDRCNYRAWVRAEARRDEREEHERHLL